MSEQELNMAAPMVILVSLLVSFHFIFHSRYMLFSVGFILLSVAMVRGNSTEVSQCVKWLVFGFNVLFWVVGGGLLGIGLWAWAEKDVFNNLSNLTSTGAYFDPALMFICVGAMAFFVGFCGCIGALRENTTLLLVYIIIVALLLLCELSAGIIFFVFKDTLREQIRLRLLDAVVAYRDDVDLQNLVDWVQEDWLLCCGVNSFGDWDGNVYFNCSSIGIEACGVPFSCCVPDPNDLIKNRQCGYKVRDPQNPTALMADAKSRIYPRGCLAAGEEWLQLNLVPVAAVAVAIALVQILGVCCGHSLRSDIFAQRTKFMSGAPPRRRGRGGGGGGQQPRQQQPSQAGAGRRTVPSGGR